MPLFFASFTSMWSYPVLKVLITLSFGPAFSMTSLSIRSDKLQSNASLFTTFLKISFLGGDNDFLFIVTEYLLDNRVGPGSGIFLIMYTDRLILNGILTLRLL